MLSRPLLFRRLLIGPLIIPLILFLAISIQRCQGQPPTDDGSCFTTINAVVLHEAFMVTNISIPRTHSLCPNTRYEIGYLDYSNNLYNGQDMIPLRSNMHIRCGGGDGGSGNSQDCIIAGGDIQVDGSNVFYTSKDAVENVLFEGLTFVNASMHNVWINKPGSVTFKNCTFRDNALALTPVLADYSSNNDTAPASLELSITFNSCLFENNRFAGPPAQPALVVANGMRNRLVFHDCNFVGNDMLEGNEMFETSGFLVETNGPLTMVRNCFSFNELGAANVATYGAGSLYYDNYQRASDGLQCRFVSRYMTATQVEENTPFCMDFDAPVCGAGATPAPTSQSPTMAPTTLFRPSAAPLSSSPTFPPTAEPTAESTYQPNAALSASRTIPPLRDAASTTTMQARSSGSRLLSPLSFHWMSIVALFGLSSTLFLCFM